MIGRRGRWVPAVAVGVVLVSGQGVVPASASSEVVVRRTAHGIPHILAGDYRGLGYGAGYAYASDNLCLLADTVVTLSAERSRWFGGEGQTATGADNLASDFYHQRVNQSGVVERLLSRPEPLGPSRQARDLVRGYVAGYNRYLAERTVAGLPDNSCRGARWVRPLTEIDLWRRAYQIASVGDEFQDWTVMAQPPGSASRVRPADLRRPADLGSNAFALGRRATTGRTGMVLGAPHSPWVGDHRLYQLQLTIPGELNVSGITFGGVPVVGMGHNEQLAWAHTSSTFQPITLHRLALAAGDPQSYVVDGRVRAMQRETVTVSVRQPDGGLAPVTRTLYRVPEGVVFAAEGFDWTATTAYVMRDPNATNLRAIDQWLAMAKARDVASLHAAQARVLGIATFNTLAADTTGTAFFGGVQVVPHVTDELLARCGTLDEGLVVLDGSRSSCGWGSDPDAVEPGLLGPGRLPTLIRTDYVSNTNNSPWLTNPAAPLTGYPAVVGEVGTEPSPRTRLALDMIASRLAGSDGLGPAGFTLPTLQATTFANRNLTAEHGRAAVAAMCAANPSLTASDGSSVDVRAACGALAEWNGRADLPARGAALWRGFVDRLRQRGVDVWRVPFDPADPVRTPRGFAADRAGVRQALADTVQAFQAAGLAVDVPLGDFQRYAGVPIHGCTSAEGCFNVASLDGARRPGEVTRGTTFVMAVELTSAGPRSRTILTYSQSVNPASPYYRDQTRLFSAKQWVTGRFTEAEIANDPSLTVLRLPVLRLPAG